jgi:pyridoxamine 5'-phosphate oxidase
MKNISHIRTDYIKGELSKPLVDSDPLKQFEQWMHHAFDANVLEPTAMSLATVSKEGKARARIVLLKYYNEKGFVFFTNYESDKAVDINANKNAALLFFWKELERQVRIEGSIKVLDKEQSDYYFRERPFQSRVSAVVSPQSQEIPNRAFLLNKHKDLIQDYSKKQESLERPSYWGGYRLIPDHYEFWQGRANRLHDRIAYSIEKNIWIKKRLAP